MSKQLAIGLVVGLLFGTAATATAVGIPRITKAGMTCTSATAEIICYEQGTMGRNGLTIGINKTKGTLLTSSRNGRQRPGLSVLVGIQNGVLGVIVADSRTDKIVYEGT